MALPMDEISFSISSLSVQFSHSVVSDSLHSHGLQDARLPRPSPTPAACSNSYPSNRWYHPTISSSVIPFSSCLQYFPTSVSFLRSQFFTSGGQNIGASASASVFPMNIQDWFPFGLTGWISLQSKGLSRVFSNTTVQKHQFFGAQLSLCKKRKMLLSSLLFSAIGKASSDNRFAFLHFFFLGMFLIVTSCIMSWTSVHSFSGTLFIRSNPLNLFVASTV